MLKRVVLKALLLFANEHRRPLLYKRFLGVEIGEQARFTGLINFGSEPFLISIGNHVTLAHNVTFHTHDGGVWVLRNKYPEINVYGRIVVGSNVFVGSNVIILPNVCIGDDVVIGAGSVVTKSVPSGSIVAGNPARFVRTVAEYEEKVLGYAVTVDSSDTTKVRDKIALAAVSRQ